MPRNKDDNSYWVMPRCQVYVGFLKGELGASWDLAIWPTSDCDPIMKSELCKVFNQILLPYELFFTKKRTCIN